MDLYYLSSCPYCQHVINALQELKLKEDSDYSLKNINQKEYYNELLEKGGKIQVPFIASEQPKLRMYESYDIIDYLKKNYSC